MRYNSIRVLMAGASLLASSAAMAQQAPTASPDNETVPDIIVTAQNRAESVQNVPIAISVISGDTLKSQGVTDFTSVAKVSPALQVTSDTTNTRVSVRGIGTLSNNEAQDQSVAVNVDGEYINRPTILNAAIFDLERVEVLRGPQGTLYGRNSTAGAVNFITRKPGDAFRVNGSVSYGNYNAVIAEGGVDVPLGDVGAFRVSGTYSYHDGYIYSPNTPISLPQFQSNDGGHRSGNDNTWGVRGSLRLEPLAGLEINASVEHDEMHIIPAVQAYQDLNAAGGCSASGFVEVGPITPGVQCVPQNTNFLSKINRGNYDMPLTGVGKFDQESTAFRGRVAYNFGPATLTYTGGYRETSNTGFNSLAPAYAFSNYGASVKTQSHELRLNGEEGRFKWQFGGFYFKELQNTNGGLYSPFIGPPGNTKGSYITYPVHPTNSQNYSAFGQAEYGFTDQLTAVGGVRYTKDTRSATFFNYGFVFNSGYVELTGTPSVAVPLHYSGDKITWLGGLNYKPNADTLIYGKVSTGYKGGGFDGSGATFRPESNTAYEGGLKLNYGPSSHNTFNLAGFYYDYKDLQNDVLLNNVTGAQTFNAGNATVWGVEAESTIRLSPRDTFTASFNYLHARYDTFIASYSVLDTTNPGNAALSTAENANLKGNRLPQAPQVVIGVGYDHVFDLGPAGRLTARAYSRFKSDYYLDFYNYRDSRQTAFTQTDLSIEYKPANGKYGLQVFARNLENIRPLVYSSYVAAGTDDIYVWQFGAPRTYGARLSIDF
ncbi:TonB-dependent receptor [Sphingomonas populi]|uniref:TonB-dependent receptor n=1 Tax=Sphingomonas populi TaxID=2484750 RepID=A0A4Q6Y973_9SPHN|nr:TonB-dependent receptor [Sphingomonas populi]RZF66099.1 TonB-dependent receptor [Sphingomonas populi]